MGGFPIFNKLGSGLPRKIHTKFEGNPCTSLRQEVKKWDITN